MNTVFRTYLLPGLVFQSVIIGGGYGTGREIAEFFLSHGAVGGLLGLGTTAGWAAGRVEARNPPANPTPREFPLIRSVIHSIPPSL